LTATGARIGASTMIEAEVSMNMPITNSAALTPSRNMPPEVRCAFRKSPMASGTPARVIRKLKRPALAMMNMITAEEITDLRKIG